MTAWELDDADENKLSLDLHTALVMEIYILSLSKLPLHWKFLRKYMSQFLILLREPLNLHYIRFCFSALLGPTAPSTFSGFPDFLTLLATPYLDSMWPRIMDCCFLLFSSVQSEVVFITTEYYGEPVHRGSYLFSHSRSQGGYFHYSVPLIN